MAMDDATFQSLPEAVRARARHLNGQILFPADAALDAIEHWRGAGVAVVGAEQWAVVGRLPKWVSAGDFMSNADYAGAEEVEHGANGARAFIERARPTDPTALYSLALRTAADAATAEQEREGFFARLWRKARGG